MTNVTNSDVISNISLTMKNILVVPEFCNFCLLGIGLLQMYHGIEIGHPVFAILLANLLVALSFSFLGIMTYFYLTNNSYILGNILYYLKFQLKFVVMLS